VHSVSATTYKQMTVRKANLRQRVAKFDVKSRKLHGNKLLSSTLQHTLPPSASPEQFLKDTLGEARYPK